MYEWRNYYLVNLYRNFYHMTDEVFINIFLIYERFSQLIITIYIH